MNTAVLCGSLEPTGGTQITVIEHCRVLAASGHGVLAISGDAGRPPGLPAECRWLGMPDLFRTSLRPSSVARCVAASFALRETIVRTGTEVAHVHFEAPAAIRALNRMLATIRYVHTPSTWCPAGTRWLPASERVCDAPPGLSCFRTDRREGCLVDLEGRRLSLKAALRRVSDIPLQAALYRGAALVAVNSDYTGDMIRRWLRVDARRIVVLPPVVREPETPPPSPTAGRLFVSGRLVGVKGIADAIAVAAAIPGSTLAIAGDGPDRTNLGRLATRLGVGDRVTFLGWVAPDRIAEEIGRAQVVLMPSRWPEPFGRSGAEAARLGRPVVAWDVGGIRSWLSPDAGVLVPAGDRTAFIDAVARLLRDPARAGSLGDRARQVTERLSPSAAAARLDDAMQRAVDGWRDSATGQRTVRSYTRSY